MQRTLFAIALCAGMAAGCGGSGRFVQKGIDRYDRADYPGAMDEFAAQSGSERSFNQKGLVRYLVYRGLTQYHLGQRSEAQSYLSRGKEAYERGTPGWLTPEIAAEMNKALADLNGQAAPAGSPADVGAPPAPPTPPASTATAVTTAAPEKPPPASTGEALVATKPTPAKPSNPTPTPVKPVSVPTKTSSSSQSTSPK